MTGGFPSHTLVFITTIPRHLKGRHTDETPHQHKGLTAVSLLPPQPGFRMGSSLPWLQGSLGNTPMLALADTYERDQ